ncbi:MAG TPA: MaoC family dehydratase [Steroidobacteraceae bacterium]|nr:MaoC family dehydratase [Steroidobacteraceae bacterium]HXS29992.1 MaoC family dehydratase [Steroidobacteraceae bacterium]
MTNSPEILTVSTLDRLVGRKFAPTDWIDIDQQRIDRFADCTGDHQFIHVDPERVARETPFRGTLAHGFLLLSLAAGHRQRDFPPVSDAALVLNYGLDRLRFTSPVFAGSRVRYHSSVVAAEPRGPGRTLLRQEAQLEVEGQDQPALVAELLALYVARGA